MQYLIKLSDGQEIEATADKLQCTMPVGGLSTVQGFTYDDRQVFQFNNVVAWKSLKDKPGQTTRTTDKSCCNHGKEPVTAKDILYNQVVSTGSDEVQGVATTFRAHLELSEDGRISGLVELH